MQAEVLLTVLDDPDPAVRERILGPLAAFNASNAGAATPQPLAIVIKDPANGEVVGGLWATSVYDWLYVELLFVPVELRTRGVGSSLIKRAEESAVRRGCLGVRLDTYSFQAPHFYEKRGYSRYGRLADHPKGHERIYYFKRLNALTT